MERAVSFRGGFFFCGPWLRNQGTNQQNQKTNANNRRENALRNLPLAMSISHRQNSHSTTKRKPTEPKNQPKIAKEPKR
jgi:hypothetical protein